MKEIFILNKGNKIGSVIIENVDNIPLIEIMLYSVDNINQKLLSKSFTDVDSLEQAVEEYNKNSFDLKIQIQ